MTARAFVVRGAAFFALWVVLAGTAPADLAFGVFAAMAAAWASVRLLPPSGGRIRPAGAVAYAGRFLWQSIRGSWDVARRAFDPRLPLAPGFADLRTRLAPGPARDLFASLSGLLPGTVPVDDDGERLRYHCLDTREPVAESLAAEEGEFMRAQGTGDAGAPTRGET